RLSMREGLGLAAVGVGVHRDQAFRSQVFFMRGRGASRLAACRPAALLRPAGPSCGCGPAALRQNAQPAGPRTFHCAAARGREIARRLNFLALLPRCRRLYPGTKPWSASPANRFPETRAMAPNHVTLDDKYDLTKSRIFVTGFQALVRLCLMQKERDRRGGLNTAGYVTG